MISGQCLHFITNWKHQMFLGDRCFSGVSRRYKMGTMSEICYIGKNKIDLMHIFTDIFKQYFITVILGNYISSHRRCSVKKAGRRNFAKFTGKHLCLRPATWLKKSLWHRCVPVNLAKFLRTLFVQNTSRRLLLYLYGKKVILRYNPLFFHVFSPKGF